MPRSFMKCNPSFNTWLDNDIEKAVIKKKKTYHVMRKVRMRILAEGLWLASKDKILAVC